MDLVFNLQEVGTPIIKCFDIPIICNKQSSSGLSGTMSLEMLKNY